MPRVTLQPRDPRLTSAKYLALAQAYRKGIAAGKRLKSDAVLRSIADKHVLVALALYSAGAPVAECLRELAAAADFFSRHLAASVRRPLSGIANMPSYMEGLSAAQLTGSLGRRAGALEQARFLEISVWQAESLSLICAAYGHPISLSHNGKVEQAAPGFGKHFQALFTTVVRRKRDAFGNALERYLREEWAPIFGAGTEANLRSGSYVGQWALFSAALCKVMGFVPELAPDVRQFVPAELAAVPGTERSAAPSTTPIPQLRRPTRIAQSRRTGKKLSNKKRVSSPGGKQLGKPAATMRVRSKKKRGTR
jgi:hypothetical protein